jgi:hypothetical protein
MKQPIQPIREEDGVVRFRPNAIVCYLLDAGGVSMNDLARMEFSDEDREQFAQLIGYSLSGFGELHYVSDETFATAKRMATEGIGEPAARVATLEETLANIRAGLKSAALAAFRIHPDDLVP